MRLTLFQAERRLLEARMQVAYYRDMVAFLEDVSTKGVEDLVDQRRATLVAAKTLPAQAPCGTGLSTVPDHAISSLVPPRSTLFAARARQELALLPWPRERLLFADRLRRGI